MPGGWSWRAACARWPTAMSASCCRPTCWRSASIPSRSACWPPRRSWGRRASPCASAWSPVASAIADRCWRTSALMVATRVAALAFEYRLLAAAADRVRRHAQSLDRRRQRLPPLEHAVLRCVDRQRAHRCFRALQPRRFTDAAARGTLSGCRRHATQFRDFDISLRCTHLPVLCRPRPARACSTAGCCDPRPADDGDCRCPAGEIARRWSRRWRPLSIDAFGGGLIVQSLLALWLYERFAPRSRLRRARSSGPICCPPVLCSPPYASPTGSDS